MSSSFDAVKTKCECTESADIITLRPIEGKVKLMVQGAALKRSSVTFASMDSVNPSGTCMTYGSNCSGLAEVGVTESAYSGTPYKVVTLTSVGG